LVDVRIDLLVDELPHGLAKQLMGFRKARAWDDAFRAGIEDLGRHERILQKGSGTPRPILAEARARYQTGRAAVVAASPGTSNKLRCRLQ
jgi:hypothetical protein